MYVLKTCWLSLWRNAGSSLTFCVCRSFDSFVALNRIDFITQSHQRFVAVLFTQGVEGSKVLLHVVQVWIANVGFELIADVWLSSEMNDRGGRERDEEPTASFSV